MVILALAFGVSAGAGQKASERCVSVARWAVAKCRRRGQEVVGEGCEREREVRLGKRVVCRGCGMLVEGSASAADSQESRVGDGGG